MQRDLRAVLKRKLPELKRLFQRESHVVGVWLFGSQADGTATEYSDIDLGVLFDRELTWSEQIGFEVAVCDILGTQDVDVVDVNRVKLRMRFRVLVGKFETFWYIFMARWMTNAYTIFLKTNWCIFRIF